MKRPATTILAMTSDFVLRADFAPGPKPVLVNFARQTRAPDSSADQTIAAALSSGQRCGRETWVLCEDAWAQMLALPPGSVAGLNAEELTRAFSFESEPLSGISAANAELAFVKAERTDDLQAFWITVIDSGLRSEIQKAIKQSGSRLAGICHPGGLSQPLFSPGNARQWRRVELWKQATFCITGEGSRTTRVQILNANTSQPRVQASVSSWMLNALAEHSEILEPRRNARNDGQSVDGHRCDFNNDEQVKQWLTQWQAHLQSESLAVPMIRPESLRTPTSTYAFAAIALVVVSLAACLGHRHWLSGRVTSLREELANLAKPKQQIAELEKTLKSRRAELEQLKNSRKQNHSTGAQLSTRLAMQKQRLFTLLQSLARSRPEDVVVSSITSDSSGNVEVKGLSLTASDADELATQVSSSLRGSNWAVEPVQKKARQQLDDGGPWDFTLNVLNVEEPQTEPQKPAASEHVQRYRLPDPRRLEASR